MKIISPAVLVAALGVVSSAWALDFDFSGNFNQDNDIVRLNFTVAAPSTVTVFSSSWDDGGFDPILAIWSASGVKQAEQDDGLTVGSTFSNGVSYDHGVWDSFYTVVLPAGDYIATIGQFNNFSVTGNLGDGFIWDNTPHFTFDQGYGPEPDFNGVFGPGDARTSDWVFHLLNVQTATVGVPDGGSALMMVALGLGGLVLGTRRFARR